MTSLEPIKTKLREKKPPKEKPLTPRVLKKQIQEEELRDFFSLSEEERKHHIRKMTRMYYDLQTFRLSAANRDTADKKAVIYLTTEDIQSHVNFRDKFYKLEKEVISTISKMIEHVPICQWLQEIRGIGPTLSAVIYSEFDIHKAYHMSNFFRFAGLAAIPVENDEDKLRRVEKPKKGEELHYNKFLKMKMLNDVGGCLMRADNAFYRQIFDYYRSKKERSNELVWHYPGNGKPLTKMPWKDVSDGHRKDAANRYMVKFFIGHVWQKWRELEKLPNDRKNSDWYATSVANHQYDPVLDFNEELSKMKFMDLIVGGKIAPEYDLFKQYS